MVVTSIGDMRQHFLNAQNNSQLRNNLNTLVQELTTGTAADLTSHLGPEQNRLSDIVRKIEFNDRFTQANEQTAQMISIMQTTFSAIDAHRSRVSGALLAINEASSPSQIQNTADVSKAGFEATVNALNTRLSGNTLFGGNDLDTTPLVSSDHMLDEIKMAAAGSGDAADLKAAVDIWFDTPGGGFETIGYQSDASGHIERRISQGESVKIDVRADNAVLRSIMKSFVLGALAGDSSFSLSNSERQELQSTIGVDLVEVAAPLVGLQANLGYSEGQIEEASARLNAQSTSLEIARSNLISADPFETATKLEQVQLQLETHYTLTSRLSRLSLTEYLR